MSNINKPKSNIFQEIMGNRITQLVMWGTIFIGVVGVAFALLALTMDENKVKTAFGILQYVFGALLPLWGTWIGTILAYYYSRENFESANKSVQQLVEKMTSEKKLESVKATSVMIPKEKLTFQTLGDQEDLSKFKLKEDCLDFVEKNKIKRVILLNEKACAKYVIHRDTISFFIAKEILKGNSITGYTLKDMQTKGSTEIKAIFDNSVKFIAEDANLLAAKNLMQQYTTCQDVFITKSGNDSDPIIGWITNITVTENSIV